jgi:hypothetical protein
MSKRCEKCGRRIPDGSLAFEVRIQVAADFDGVLPAPDDADPQGQARALLKAIAGRDAEALLRDVVHTERHLLCPGCRDRYLANPLNLPLPDGRP